MGFMVRIILREYHEKEMGRATEDVISGSGQAGHMVTQRLLGGIGQRASGGSLGAKLSSVLGSSPFGLPFHSILITPPLLC